MKIMILAGGGGTRLYPLSNPDAPKQFLPLANEKPLLINTVERFLSICKPSDIIVVTGEKYRALTQETLSAYNFGEIGVVYEPCARNTAPAIMLGVRYLIDKMKVSENEVFFVAPSDHVIEPLEEYLQTVRSVLAEAGRGKVVTIGIVPQSPDTGFGYILAQSGAAKEKKVLAFKEKPDAQTAKEYVKSGNYYWNAGMYAFTGAVFAQELKRHAPPLFTSYQNGYDGLTAGFSEIDKISIDYALAEKSQNISVVPYSGNWSDIGSWDAYYEFCDKDESGNVVLGNIKHENCKGCLLLCYDGHLTVFDQSDSIIIGANGNFIVLPRGKSQQIKG